MKYDFYLPATELSVFSPVNLCLAKQRNGSLASFWVTLRMWRSPWGKTEYRPPEKNGTFAFSQLSKKSTRNFKWNLFECQCWWPSSPTSTRSQWDTPWRRGASGIEVFQYSRDMHRKGILASHRLGQQLESNLIFFKCSLQRHFSVLLFIYNLHIFS